MDFMTEPKFKELVTELFSTSDFQSLSPPIPELWETFSKGSDFLAVLSESIHRDLFLLVVIVAVFLQTKKQLIVICPTKTVISRLELLFPQHLTKFEMTYCTISGGQKSQIQLRALKRNPAIIFATPGRLISMVKHRQIHIDRFTHLIMADADLLFKSETALDIEKIINLSSFEKQTILFSGVYNSALWNVAQAHMRHPAIISADKLPEFTTHTAKRPNPRVANSPTVETPVPRPKRLLHTENLPQTNMTGTPLSKGASWRDEWNSLQIDID